MTEPTRTTPADTTGCVFDRSAAVTRSLLGYGVLAGVVYVVAGAVQALTRDGFDPTRHDLSLLAAGPWGWIQAANLVVSGLMVLAAAVGVRRALRPGRAATAGPVLLAGYGLGLVVSGMLSADPMNGYPGGTPDGPPAAPSGHGLGHLLGGSLGFVCLVAAMVVLAGRLGRDGSPALARGSGAAAVVFAVSFVGIATGSSSPLVVLGFTVGVLVAWIWLAALSVHLYRRVPVFVPAAAFARSG